MNLIRSLFFRNLHLDAKVTVDSVLDSEDEEGTVSRIRRFIEDDGSLDKLEQAVAVRLQPGSDFDLKKRYLSRLNNAIEYTREYRIEQKGQKPPLWQRIRFWVAHFFRFSDLYKVEKKFDRLTELVPNGGYNTGELVFHACGSGNLSLLERLTQKNADLGWKRPLDFQTHLHAAVGKGSLAVVTHLTRLGADPFVLAGCTTSTFSGCVTPFMWAVVSRQHELVQYFADRYPDLMKVFSDSSPLQQAVRQNDLPMVEILIKLLEKSNDNKEDVYRQVFKEALSEGDPAEANDEIVKLLLVKIKDLDVEFLRCVANSIYRAIEKGKNKTVEYIIQTFKDREITSKEIDDLLRKGLSFAESVGMARLLWDNIHHDQTKVDVRDRLMLELLRRNPNPAADLIQYYTNLTIHFFANNSEKCPLLYTIQHANAATLQVVWDGMKQQLLQRQKGTLLLQIANRYLTLIPTNHFARGILAPDNKLSYAAYEALAVY